jgi:hypothetical protein
LARCSQQGTQANFTVVDQWNTAFVELGLRQVFATSALTREARNLAGFTAITINPSLGQKEPERVEFSSGLTTAAGVSRNWSRTECEQQDA